MIFTIAALPLVAGAMIWLCFYAPKMQVPNTVNFVLVIPGKKQKSEEEVHMPWWLQWGVIGVIVLCQIKPVIGAGVLIIIGGVMLFRTLKAWAVYERKKLRKYNAANRYMA